MAGQRVRQVHAGSEHSVFLMEDGSVYGCGDNAHGQIAADESTEAQLKPWKIDLGGRRVTEVVGGGLHSLFLLDDGSLMAVGDNQSGQLGIGAQGRPQYKLQGVEVPGGVKYVTAGPRHSVAVNKEGKVFSWGDNCEGVLGRQCDSKTFFHHAMSRRHCEPTPAPIDGLDGVNVVSSCAAGTFGQHKGAGHTLFLDDQGKVYSCGLNRNGQLGRETKLIDYNSIISHDSSKVGLNSSVEGHYGDIESWDAQALPQPVAFPGGTKVVQIACSGEHSMFLSDQGDVLACGNHSHGQLGFSKR